LIRAINVATTPTDQPTFAETILGMEQTIGLPIEMAFSKLKALLRAAAARTFDDLANAVGDICRLFEPRECWNFFKAAEYAYD
jgi:hypothetical protein